MAWQTPVQTPAPTYNAVDVVLAERQFTRNPTLQIAHNPTLCGYEPDRQNTNEDFLITCADANACVYDENRSAVGCCALTNYQTGICPMETSCVNYEDLNFSCRGSCFSDPYILKCTSPNSRRCVTRVYTTGLPGTVNLTEYLCWTTNGFGFATFGSPNDRTSSTTTATSQVAAETQISNVGDEDSAGGLSQGAIIAIAVCASVVGLAIVVVYIFMRRRRSNETQPSPYGPNGHTQQQILHPPHIGNFNSYSKAAVSSYQNSLGYGSHNFSEVDEDILARLRRLSHDGTVAQTAPTVTNDEYRPQAF